MIGSLGINIPHTCEACDVYAGGVGYYFVTDTERLSNDYPYPAIMLGEDHHQTHGPASLP